MWEWILYDENGDTLHHESPFETREDARLDFVSYKMALQSDDNWRDDYLVEFDALPLPGPDGGLVYPLD